MADEELQMSFFKTHKGKIALLSVLTGLGIYFATREEEKIWVSVSAVHYFPSHQRIDEFYVNRGAFGNSGFDGSADAGVCCVWLPKQWRKDLVVDVRWIVSDWSDSPFDDKEHFDYNKVKLVGVYRATVPVEKYEEADDVFVHFFDGGKVRVAPGIRDFRIKENLAESIEKSAKATVLGQKVKEVFTEKERAEMREEWEKSTARHWR